MSTEAERLQWRRNKVLELSSQGQSQPQIAKILQVGLGTINRDLQYIRQKAKENIKKYIDEKLPDEYEKTLCGLDSILREAWAMSQASESSRMEKIKALSLAKDCYSMKLELLTKATVVDDAIRLVQSKQNHGSEIGLISRANGITQNKEMNQSSLQNISVTKTVNKVF